MEHIGQTLKDIAGTYPKGTAMKALKNLENEQPDNTIGKYSFGISDERHTFATFKKWPGSEDALQAFKDLAEGKAPPFLLVYGGVGNGKTRMVNAAAIRLAERGIFSAVWIVPDFLSYLKRMINPEWPGHLDGVIEHYQATKAAVFFDDFALEYGTPWEESIMERIICGRYRNQGITVVTCNKGLGALPERIVSRFFEPGLGKVVLNKGADYRRSGK